MKFIYILCVAYHYVACNGEKSLKDYAIPCSGIFGAEEYGGASFAVDACMRKYEIEEGPGFRERTRPEREKYISALLSLPLDITTTGGYRDFPVLSEQVKELELCIGQTLGYMDANLEVNRDFLTKRIRQYMSDKTLVKGGLGMQMELPKCITDHGIGEGNSVLEMAFSRMVYARQCLMAACIAFEMKEEQLDTEEQFKPIDPEMDCYESLAPEDFVWSYDPKLHICIIATYNGGGAEYTQDLWDGRTRAIAEWKKAAENGLMNNMESLMYMKKLDYRVVDICIGQVLGYVRNSMDIEPRKYLSRIQEIVQVKTNLKDVYEEMEDRYNACAIQLNFVKDNNTLNLAFKKMIQFKTCILSACDLQEEDP